MDYQASHHSTFSSLLLDANTVLGPIHSTVRSSFGLTDQVHTHTKQRVKCMSKIMSIEHKQACCKTAVVTIRTSERITTAPSLL
jgi:hypothetical protein